MSRFVLDVDILIIIEFRSIFGNDACKLSELFLFYFGSRILHFFLLFSCLLSFFAWLLAVIGRFIRLFAHNFTIIMCEIDGFQSRLKQISQLMSKGAVNRCQLLLKQLQRQVRSAFQKPEIKERDKLIELQIMIFNNLACVFEKKGKYKSSLFHLQIAQKMESDYLTQKYNGKQMPDIVLQQLSTTYSNLSAVQSKLGQLKQALKNIEKALDILTKTTSAASKAGLVYLYYNYAILLEGNLLYAEACKFALEGLSKAKENIENIMIDKYDQLLKRLRLHITRQQTRREKEIKKYEKGEIGIFKKMDDISLNGVTSAEEQAIKPNKFWVYSLQKSKRSLSRDNNRVKADSRDKMPFYRPSLPKKSIKNISSLLTLDNLSGGKAKKNAMMEYTNSSHTYFQSNRNRTNHGIIDTYLNEDKKKTYSTHWERTIDARLKERKRRLQKQINSLGQKNEALQKVIEKMYTTDKPSS